MDVIEKINRNLQQQLAKKEATSSKLEDKINDLKEEYVNIVSEWKTATKKRISSLEDCVCYVQVQLKQHEVDIKTLQEQINELKR